MSRLQKMGKTALAALLAAALAAPVQVSAKPQELEYLEDLAEAQEERAQPSLLEQTLGLDGLLDGIEENGLSFDAKLGPTQETLRALGVGADVLDSCDVEVGVQIDPAQERWLFDLAALMDDEELVGAALYADRDQLALSLPQRYEGAVGIRSGSFRGQYEGSVIEEILGALPEELPDFDLDFFPDPEGIGEFGSFDEEFEEAASEGAALIEDGASVAVREEDGQTVYTVSYRKADVIRCVKTVIDGYMRMLRNSTLISMDEGELSAFEAELEEGCDVLDLVLEDELLFDYYVENDLVAKVHFELNLDMNRLEPERTDAAVNAGSPAEAQGNPAEAGSQAGQEMQADSAEAGSQEMQTAPAEAGSQADSGNVTDAADLTSPAVEYDPEYEAHFLCDLVYVDPADLGAGLELTMAGVDGAGVEHVRLGVSQTREQTGTTEVNSLRLSIEEEGEVLYEEALFDTTFDAQTGDYSVRMHMEDEDTDMAISLDGTFTDIQKEKQFRFVIDEASLAVNGDSFALSGEIFVGAAPETFDAPERVRMVMELSEEELINLMTEIQVKSAILAQKLMPETEVPGAYGEEPETEVPGMYGEEPETELTGVHSEKDV